MCAQVEYVRDLGPPVMSIEHARAAAAFHKLPPIAGITSNVTGGRAEVLAAVSASPLQIRGARWRIPNQTHFYMEPQTSIATPDEGGNIQVHLQLKRDVTCQHAKRGVTVLNHKYF